MAGAWAVVALAVAACWVVASCVTSLGREVVSSLLETEPGSTSTRCTIPSSTGPSVAGRTGVEAAVAPELVDSGAGAVAVRSHASFQVVGVCRDKV